MFCSSPCSVAFYAAKNRQAVLPKACPECGKTFVGRRAYQVYCSNTCRAIAYITRRADGKLKYDPRVLTGTCLDCGKEFKLKTTAAGLGIPSSYCRHQCRANAYHRGVTARGPIPNGVCVECGKEFPRRYKGSLRKYCSTQCSKAASQRRQPFSTCPECGEQFQRFGAKNVYCSRKCVRSAQKAAKISRACMHCGGPLNLGRKFCSRACYVAFANSDKNPRRHGSTVVTKDGYVAQMVHGRAVAQHRVIMEQHLGRALAPGETIHHKNGVRTDNRIENLELWAGNHRRGQRVADMVAWAKETLQRYEPSALAQPAPVLVCHGEAI